jgi:hypothetical protein
MEDLKYLEPLRDCSPQTSIFRLLHLERAIDEKLTAFGYITRPVWIKTGGGEIDGSCLFKIAVREINGNPGVYSREFRYGDISPDLVEQIAFEVTFL